MGLGSLTLSLSLSLSLSLTGTLILTHTHTRTLTHTLARTRTCAACGYCRRTWRATASEGRISRSARSSRPLSARRQREWPE